MKRRLSALLFAALGVLSSCDGSSTDPIEVPLVFVGEVAFQSTEFHAFTVVSTGTIRIELVRLQEKVAEGAEPLGLDLAVGLGVGRPSGEQCSTTFSVLATEGDLVVLGLPGAEFCVSVFDNGSFLPGQVAEYTVSVSTG